MNEILEKHDILQYLADREMFYKFLASLYEQEVTEEFLSQMRQQKFALNSTSDDQSRGYRLLVACLGRKDALSQRKFSADYARLFLGAGIYELEQSTPPYESVYTSETGMLMQDARDEVVRLYYQEHVDICADTDIPEDHLSYELQFMSLLMHNSYIALEQDNQDEIVRLLKVSHEFLLKHLVSWVPAFTYDILRLSTTDFYKAVALITRGFISTEERCLCLVINSLAPDSIKDNSLDAQRPSSSREVSRRVEQSSDEIDLTKMNAKADKEQENVADCQNESLSADSMEQYSDPYEKADLLFSRMGFLKRVFIAALDYCTEARTTDELLASLAEAQKYSRSPYQGIEIINMLANADCIANINDDFCDRLYEDDDIDKTLDIEIPNAKANGFIRVGDIPDEQIVYISAEEVGHSQDEPAWMTTDIGDKYRKNEDPFELIKKLFETEEKYSQGYKNTLTMINEGQGKFTQIEEMIKQTDYYQVDNRHASAFLKRLEDAGAIEWRGHEWGISPAGKDVLAELSSGA